MAAPRGRGALRHRPDTLVAALVVAACGGLLVEVCSFLAPTATGRRQPVGTAQGARLHRRAVRLAAEGEASAAEVEEEEEVTTVGSYARSMERPRPPNSTEAMTKQAADAAMRGYRDGVTRQSIKLRLDAAYRAQDSYFGGIGVKLEATLPLVSSFAKKLWGGEMLEEVRTTAIEEEGASTLVYRRAMDNLYDVAIFFLTGRSTVTAPKVRRYFDQFGDRLIIMLNSEDASDPFKVSNKALDFVIGENKEIGAEVVEMFKEITYFYAQGQFNNWQLIEFHAYPHPWEIWIENLDYKLEYIGEFDHKPTFEEIQALTESYEEKNGIPYSKKLGKIIKDQGRELQYFADAQLTPPWEIK